jgi:hypothetical protein
MECYREPSEKLARLRRTLVGLQKPEGRTAELFDPLCHDAGGPNDQQDDQAVFVSPPNAKINRLGPADRRFNHPSAKLIRVG